MDNINWKEIWTKMSRDVRKLAGRIKKETARRWRRTRLEDYYYSGGESQKNFRARSIDKIFFRILVFLSVSLAFYFLSRDFPISVFNGVVWTAAVHVIAGGRRKKKAEKNKERILKQRALDKFSHLTEDKSSGEFFAMVQELLRDNELFSELNCVTEDEGRPVIIRGYFKGEKTGIYAKKLEKDGMVAEKELKDFVEYCRITGLENGIYITNGAFDYAARGYAAGLDDFNLFLADKEAIYKIFIKNNNGLFSMTDLEKKVEQAALEQSHSVKHNLKKILALRRVKTYAVLSILIGIYSVKVPYTLYYIFVSAVLLCLSVTALVRWKVERHKEHVEEGIKLDRAMDIE